MFKLKNKNKICKKYQEDIWGTFRVKKQINKVMLLLISLLKVYKTRYKPFFLNVKGKPLLKKRRRLSNFGKKLETRHKLCYFYGGLRKKQYDKFISLSLKKKGNFVFNFLSCLEFRLVTLIFRMNFCSNISTGIQLVLGGNILVNNEIIKEVNYIAKVGDIISVLPSSKEVFFLKCKNEFVKQNIYLYQPKYLYVNFSCMSGIVLEQPTLKTTFYPFKIYENFLISESVNK